MLVRHQSGLQSIICKAWTGVSAGILANSAPRSDAAEHNQGLHHLLKLQEE